MAASLLETRAATQNWCMLFVIASLTQRCFAASSLPTFYAVVCAPCLFVKYVIWPRLQSLHLPATTSIAAPLFGINTWWLVCLAALTFACAILCGIILITALTWLIQISSWSRRRGRGRRRSAIAKWFCSNFGSSNNLYRQHRRSRTNKPYEMCYYYDYRRQRRRCCRIPVTCSNERQQQQNKMDDVYSLKRKVKKKTAELMKISTTHCPTQRITAATDEKSFISPSTLADDLRQSPAASFSSTIDPTLPLSTDSLETTVVHRLVTEDDRTMTTTTDSTLLPNATWRYKRFLRFFEPRIPFWSSTSATYSQPTNHERHCHRSSRSCHSPHRPRIYRNCRRKLHPLYSRPRFKQPRKLQGGNSTLGLKFLRIVIMVIILLIWQVRYVYGPTIADQTTSYKNSAREFVRNDVRHYHNATSAFNAVGKKVAEPLKTVPAKLPLTVPDANTFHFLFASTIRTSFPFDSFRVQPALQSIAELVNQRTMADYNLQIMLNVLQRGRPVTTTALGSLVRPLCNVKAAVTCIDLLNKVKGGIDSVVGFIAPGCPSAFDVVSSIATQRNLAVLTGYSDLPRFYRTSTHKRTRYKYLTSFSYTQYHISRTIAKVLRFFHWKDVAIFIDRGDPFYATQGADIAQYLSVQADRFFQITTQLCCAATLTTSPSLTLDSAAVDSVNAEYDALLRSASAGSRIFIFSVNGDKLRQFILRANALGFFDYGEYVFFSIAPFTSEAMYGNHGYIRSDGHDSTAELAYESLLSIQIHRNVQGLPSLQLLVDGFLGAAASGSYNLWDPEEIIEGGKKYDVSFLVVQYYSVLAVYLSTVSLIALSGGDITNQAAALTTAARKKTLFSTVDAFSTARRALDPSTGFLKYTYSIYDFNSETKLFDEVATIDPLTAEDNITGGITFLKPFLEWQYAPASIQSQPGYVIPPKNVPVCGYQNEISCPRNTPAISPTAEAFLIILGIVVGGAGLFCLGVVLLRYVRYKRLIRSTVWQISWKELEEVKFARKRSTVTVTNVPPTNVFGKSARIQRQASVSSDEDDDNNDHGAVASAGGRSRTNLNVPPPNFDRSSSRSNSRTSENSHGLESDDDLCLEDVNFNRIKLFSYRGTIVAAKKIPLLGHLPTSDEALYEIRTALFNTHKNLNKFYGITHHKTKVSVIEEYCGRGSLDDLLRNAPFKLDWPMKVTLMSDIVSGLNFIHGTAALSVHGRLRSSNCLVDGRLSVKLSSFALPMLRKYTESPHAITKTNADIDRLKLKRDQLWVAPELLRATASASASTSTATVAEAEDADDLDIEKDKKIKKSDTTDNHQLIPTSQKGDVYSFAIIMHEIRTEKLPYQVERSEWGLSINTILQTVKIGLEPAFRPRTSEADVAAPASLATLTAQCWSENPLSRPAVFEVTDVIRRLDLQLSSGLSILESILKRLETQSHNLESTAAERAHEINEEKLRSDALFNELLPASIAEQIIQEGTYTGPCCVEPIMYESVTIGMAAIYQFVMLCAPWSAEQVVHFLNVFHSMYDQLLEMFNLYHMARSTGDAHMCVAGLPVPTSEHAEEVAKFLLDARDTLVAHFKMPWPMHKKLELVFGIHSGSVAAGVVWGVMPRYCLFGSAVNVVERITATSLPNRIHVTEASAKFLHETGRYILHPCKTPSPSENLLQATTPKPVAPGTTAGEQHQTDAHADTDHHQEQTYWLRGKLDIRIEDDEVKELSKQIQIAVERHYLGSTEAAALVEQMITLFEERAGLLFAVSEDFYNQQQHLQTHHDGADRPSRVTNDSYIGGDRESDSMRDARQKLGVARPPPIQLPIKVDFSHVKDNTTKQEPLPPAKPTSTEAVIDDAGKK